MTPDEFSTRLPRSDGRAQSLVESESQRQPEGAFRSTNGLIRQYFPKSTDLNKHSAHRVAEVARELNDRPRKTLGMRTPNEIFGRVVKTAPATVAAIT